MAGRGTKAADEEQPHRAEEHDRDADLLYGLHEGDVRGEGAHQCMPARIEAEDDPALRQKARNAHPPMPLPSDVLPREFKPLRQSERPSFAPRADSPTSGMR